MSGVPTLKAVELPYNVYWVCLTHALTSEVSLTYVKFDRLA